MNKKDKENKVTKCWSCESDGVKLYNPIINKFYDIDNNISQLIKEIWNAGIHLIHICGHNWQEYPSPDIDCIWFSFGSEKHYENFLNCVTIGLKSDSEQFKRIIGISSEYNWRHRIQICPDTYFEEVKNKSEYSLPIDIRFPSLDYKFVLKAMEKYNKINKFNCKKDNDDMKSDYKYKTTIFYEYIDNLAKLSMGDNMEIYNLSTKSNFNVNRNMAEFAREMWNAGIDTHDNRRHIYNNRDIVNMLMCYPKDILQLLWKIFGHMENKKEMDKIVLRWKLKIIKNPVIKNGKVEKFYTYYSIKFDYSDYEAILDLVRKDTSDQNTNS